MDDLEPVELEINGVIDLHTFNPKDIKKLVPDYIAACLEKDIFQVRIIHGKGKGTLRRIVHAALDRIPAVLSYQLAAGDAGSWGATIVELHHQET